jgi:mono/diheme cytochrome c family protein
MEIVMRRLLLSAVGLAVLGGALFWVLTAPDPLPTATTANLAGDPALGQAVFWTAGCASCHTAPDAAPDAGLVLAGGQRFASPFGTFVAPNISSDPNHGIGTWTFPEFANAVARGISPQGAHYFPAFPYNAYNKMDPQDLAHLHAFMQTLPGSTAPNAPHKVAFPFNIRRSLGGWKLLFEDRDWVITGDLTPEETRGRYLAEGLAHCAECHTPRNALGGLDHSKWLAGGPDPSGKGRIPNITPAELDWSTKDIAYYLTSGFTPEYDSVGGHMGPVVGNMAKLPKSDVDAIAAYLKRVPAVKN